MPGLPPPIMKSLMTVFRGFIHGHSPSVREQAQPTSGEAPVRLRARTHAGVVFIVVVVRRLNGSLSDACFPVTLCLLRVAVTPVAEPVSRIVPSI